MNVCSETLRDGTCTMDTGHKGRHSTVTFWCDACQKTRRGRPAGQLNDSNGDTDVVFCWFCMNVVKPWENP